MNTFYKVSLLTITILVSTFLFGQNAIEKSEKQIFIFGKKYYLHEVKKGQTLFSISSAYNVSVQEIISENSALSNDKLKVGMEIKIPTKENTVSNGTKSGEKYIYHTVEKKQTLYSLCRKYNIEEKEILRLNPEISQGLKVGQVIKVPKPGSEPINLDKDINFHTVQPGETLFSLSQRYGIEINSLKLENPEIQKEGLKTGQVVKIPKSNIASADVLNIVPTITTNNTNSSYDPLYFEEAGGTPCNEFKYNNNIKFKVAVILPFFINENYATKNSGSFYKNSSRFYEFYQGLLIAAKKMKESGVSIEFYIKDEKASAATTREILAQSEMKDMDLIIGPVYSENFKLASEFAKAHKINIVSPFKLADNSIANNNPFIFITNPSDETEIANISKYLASSYDRSIVAIHNGSEDELKTISLFKNKLVRSFSPFQQVNEIVFKEINYKSGGIGAVEDALSVGLDNIIIVPSKDDVFITNLVTKLNYLTNRYKITIFGMQAWEQNRNIELEYLKNLKFHYGTISYIEKENKNVKNFDFQYKAYFKNEPSIYAYLGFDVASYFLNELKNSGKQFQFCLSKSDDRSYSTGLRFDFNFERISPMSGFENNWIRIVKIDENFNLVKVK